MKKGTSILCGALAAICQVAEVHSQIVAVQDVVGGIPTGSVPDATYGWRFTVSAGSSLSVTELGLFDQSNDGFAEAHRVGIWDSGNNLVAEASFAAGVTGTLNNGFRYLAITPVTLQAGQAYSIGSWQEGSFDNVISGADPSSTVYASEIQYVGPGYSPDPGFGAPFKGFNPGGHGLFGANMSFEPAPVPEPHEYMIVTALGLVLFGCVRKYRAVRA